MQVCKVSMLLLKGSSKNGRVGLSDLREVAVHGAAFGWENVFIKLPIADNFLEVVT